MKPEPAPSQAALPSLPPPGSLTGPSEGLEEFTRGLGRLKGPTRAQGVVGAEGHGVHPVAVALQSPAWHALGWTETGQMPTEQSAP